MRCAVQLTIRAGALLISLAHEPTSHGSTSYALCAASVAGVSGYSENMAPCVCAKGVNQNTGTHGLMHTFQSASAAKCQSGNVALSDGSSVTKKKTTLRYREEKGR